ncbi:MAG: CPBP family intramembrane metalloprotease [Firmicutes bacterium]|nr:CPBP family intramembrane metalloprotease [Bacillota bacterium]
MIRALFDNPVSRTFIALTFALVSVLLAFGLYVTSPASFGVPNAGLNTSTIYYFADDWSVSFDYLDLEVPRGSLVVPGYNEGRVNAVLIISGDDAPGRFNLSLPQEHRGELPDTITSGTDQILLLIENNDYVNVIRDSGDTILLRADETDVPTRYLENQLEQARDLLSRYEMFGFTNYLPPTQEMVLLQIWTQRMGVVTYYEDQTVHVSGMNFDVEFQHPELEQPFYPPQGFPERVALYGILLWLGAMSIIAFVTGGLDMKALPVKGEYNPFHTIAGLLGAFIAAWGLHLYDVHFHPSQFWLAIVWTLPLALVGFWMYQARLPLSYPGISKRGLVHAVILAAVVTAFVTLGTTTRIPVGIDWHAGLFFSSLVAIVFREAFLRGFCQRVLSHWLTPWAGLLITSVIWALITASVDIGVMNHQVVLLLLSRGGQSLLVGYSYHRTGNIFAPGILATLLELAPQMLVF